MENTSGKFDENINMEHVANSALDFIQPNKIIQGEVVTIDNDFVYLNVGTKSDGKVRLEEFTTRPGVGDIIDIVLANPKLTDGLYLFSKTAADREKAWQRFTAWYGAGNTVLSGKLKSSGQKGMIVECDGIQAFLPFSLAGDIRGKKESADKRSYWFVVKDVDEKKRSVLLSRKDYIEDEKEKLWSNLIASRKAGERITGKVVKFVDFGAFVDIGGIEGLLHKNDLSWKKVFKKKKLLKLDEEREFVILNINPEEKKISLGLKQLEEDPWARIEEKYHIGDTVSGRIVTLTHFGAFIEVEDGVEGFVGTADMSWTKKSVNPKDLFARGDTVSVQILGVSREERKLSLGIRQLLPNPWDTIAERFPAGTLTRGKVKKIVSFGMFVELESDIDGLIHVSDISWDDKVKDPLASYKAGDEVEFKILEIRGEEMRISCGIKQLTKSPWEAVKEKYPRRSRVSGVISAIVPFGVFVKLEDDVEGMVHISELSRKKIDKVEDHFKVGDRVQAVVLDIDVDKKRLSLSIKHFDIVNEKEELNRVLNNTSPGRVTIGDMIKIKRGE